jgi:hypothetical protein
MAVIRKTIPKPGEDKSKCLHIIDDYGGSYIIAIGRVLSLLQDKNIHSYRVLTRMGTDVDPNKYGRSPVFYEGNTYDRKQWDSLGKDMRARDGMRDTPEQDKKIEDKSIEW